MKHTLWLLFAVAVLASAQDYAHLADVEQSAYNHEDVELGRHCYVVTAVNVPGFESDQSNEACETRAAGGSISLTWTPPTENTDGSPLTDLAGYRVYQRVESISVPAPPENLMVLEGQETAYTLQRSEDRMALVPVGVVAPGVMCDGSQSVRDANGVTAYVVPRDSVQWAGVTRTTVAFAQCSEG